MSRAPAAPDVGARRALRADAVLVVRRLAGLDARLLAVAAAVDGLALGRGEADAAALAWQAVPPRAARAALAAALGLDGLVDAPAGLPSATVPADALAVALAGGGDALAALAADLEAEAPGVGAALAGVRAAVALTVHGRRACVALAWLDCGPAGTWQVAAAAPGRSLLAPVPAAWAGAAAREALRAAAGSAPRTVCDASAPLVTGDPATLRARIPDPG